MSEIITRGSITSKYARAPRYLIKYVGGESDEQQVSTKTKITIANDEEGHPKKVRRIRRIG